MNRKKLTALTLAAALALSLSACGESAAPPQSPTPLETAEAGFTFADLQTCRFVHASGASGWGTVLTIQPDGSFSGSFSDSEWEESESGTQAVCECCEFSGQLAQPVRVNDYTYSVGIEHIEYQREPGTDEYADGIHYYFTEPRGLEDTGELLIYLPGAPMAELPEGFLGWVMGSADGAEGELPFYGLYSEARLAGFRGDPVQEPADDPDAAQTGADPLFSQLKDLEFYFSSGAGGWRTVLHIDGSGGFSGTYSDSDMGGSGEDGIWGIQYRCDFTGQFTQPVRVDDYTYSVRIDEITYEKEAGTDEVIGVTHYYYTDPYGLEDAEDILIYLPGAPLGQLPQEFRSWVGYSENTRDELPFYALNNAVHQQGFSSYDRLESIRESLEGWVEPYAAELETEITSGEFTQEVCEEKAARMYEIWDGQLNDLWDCLEQRLDPAELEPLAAEQEAWAARKEEQVTQAGADPHEGYTQAAAEDMAAAELTRDRVYELLDWLDET